MFSLFSSTYSSFNESVKFTCVITANLFGKTSGLRGICQAIFIQQETNSEICQ